MRGTAVRVLIGAMAVTSAVTLSGCVHTTAGQAHRAGGTNPTAVADLESYLLAPDRVDKIVGSQDIEVSDSATTLDDNQSNISDPECLGALYNAEQSVYDGTGWTGVADQVLADQVDDEDAEQGHWVQQSVVEFGSAQQALDFFDRSVQKWTNCIGKHVTVNDADSEFVFSIEGIGIDGHMMSQTARQRDAGDWACQHALGAATNHIVEVMACSTDTDGQALRLATEIASKIK